MLLLLRKPLFCSCLPIACNSCCGSSSCHRNNARQYRPPASLCPAQQQLDKLLVNCRGPKAQISHHAFGIFIRKLAEQPWQHSLQQTQRHGPKDQRQQQCNSRDRLPS